MIYARSSLMFGCFLYIYFYFMFFEGAMVGIDFSEEWRLFFQSRLGATGIPGIYIYIWVNYTNLTGILVYKGNHPQMALIQVLDAGSFGKEMGLNSG